MIKNSKTMIVALVATLLVGITVVVVGLGRNNALKEFATDPTVADEVSTEITVIPATEADQATEATQAEITEAPVIPTARAGLESTDPATVNLNSGEIQLVEAFAFW